ncbi:Fic/DOC family protein [Clostridium estertheticum]|uniref:Fic/DOC family protein n=1 Tax=Clostridium estertheticum TaxID=238834 RepID=UPI001C0B0017|nr:Fic family protein [Clostridium estertheticum]MBU3173366.1 Fic family protein [Clostridium estertheticum]
MQKSYCYPNSTVLINKLDIKDSSMLIQAERLSTTYNIFDLENLTKLEINPIKFKFDLNHLQEIHKYIFKDIYSWAGELRTTDLSKGTTDFARCQVIKSYSDEMFSNLKKESFLKELSIDKFSNRLSYYASEINIIHPFREGNGRSTREFIRELSHNAGYEINYSDIPKEEIYTALVKSINDYSDLTKLFKNHIIKNIKNSYIEEFPNIKYASEYLLDTLQKLKQISGYGEYVSIKNIKSLYNKLGSDLEKGISNDVSQTFRVVSDITIELNRLQVNIKNQNYDVNKNLAKHNIEPEI